MKIEYPLISTTNLLYTIRKFPQYKQTNANLMNTECEFIYPILKQNAFNEKPPQGVLEEACDPIEVKLHTINRVCRQGKDSTRRLFMCPSIYSKIKRSVVRKKYWSTIKFWQSEGFFIPENITCIGIL
jgi:hypothetical protein